MGELPVEELIEQVLVRDGMARQTIIGHFIGIELIKVKTMSQNKATYKYNKFLITICVANARLSKGIDDWYITNIHNLGGK